MWGGLEALIKIRFNTRACPFLRNNNGSNKNSNRWRGDY